MAGFVRVSGYSKTDLDNAYDDGYEQGKTDYKARIVYLYEVAGSSSSSTTTLAPITGNYFLTAHFRGNDAGADPDEDGVWIKYKGTKIMEYEGVFDGYRNTFYQTSGTCNQGDRFEVHAWRDDSDINCRIEAWIVFYN